jgi:hypothetical protein
METVKTFSLRTGWHGYPAVEMSDGETRAVWPEWDGPDFRGFATAAPGGAERPTVLADYREYCTRAERVPAL